MRYANLVAEYLPTHPQAQLHDGRKSLRIVSRQLESVVDRLENLKPLIQEKHDLWLARLRSVETYTEAKQEKPRTDALHAADLDPAIAGHLTIAAADNADLAVRLGNSEGHKRLALQRASWQSHLSHDARIARRSAGIWEDWDDALSARHSSTVDDELRDTMTDTRRMLDGQVESQTDDDSSPSRRRLSKPPPARKQVQISKFPIIQESEPISSYQDFAKPRNPAPQKPRKTPISDISVSEPPRPPKELAASQTKPIETSYTFSSSAYLENGRPLRTVFLPDRLREKFLAIAERNTLANLETCGLLCGALISNALFIQKLVIPAQTSTSDTCETIDESALFDFCDQEGLMILGWIHTHPSQTCFLSSRDLHTHYGYQIMMPEAVAIVCAPSKSPSYVSLASKFTFSVSNIVARWGVFRLTDPPGMPEIQACHRPGLFHPHDSNNIYVNALRPGHVYEAAGMDFGVVDMRVV